jgi:hypothetical protein
MSLDPLSIQDTNQQIVKDLHVMMKKDIQSGVDVQTNQGQHDYIELWFQKAIRPEHFVLQYFLTSLQSKKLVPHVLVLIKVCFSNQNVSTFVILLRTWLHWKYFYT